MFILIMVIDRYIQDDQIHESSLEEILGPACEWVETLRIPRLESSEMIIKEISPKLAMHFGSTLSQLSAQIKYRPAGILVIITAPDQQIAWAIPYHQLTLYKTDVWSIHAQGNYIQLIDTNHTNAGFFRSLMSVRTGVNDAKMN